MIEFFIAKKHLIERKKQTFTAIVGIAIGITVLIVSIAISNGLDSNMINGILSISPHITVDNRGYSISDYTELEEKLVKIDGVKGTIPKLIKLARWIRAKALQMTALTPRYEGQRAACSLELPWP